MADLPPPIPPEFQIYNSYAFDPTFQRKFSIVWGSVAAAAVLVSLPRFIKSVKRGQLLASLTGVREDVTGRNYEPAPTLSMSADKETTPKRLSKSLSKFNGLLTTISSVSLWTIPGVELDLGQVFIVIAYYVTILLCIIVQAELIDNPNRAGFMAIAQLPVVFLLATKNSPLSLLLGAGHGWEKLNFLHRWAGRGMFLSAVIHGSLWIRNHLEYDIQILGSQKETSGVACLGLLGVITLSSLRPIRAVAYQFFFIIHILASMSFFITLCYHTIYAAPWIFPPLAFYGFDILLRLLRFRAKDATLVTAGDDMTIIRIHDSDNGWTAGQHVRLRVFFSSRVFESHPLTIMSAPPRTSCFSDRSLLLGARVNGDWTRALNKYVREASLLSISATGTSSEVAAAAGPEKKGSDSAESSREALVIDAEKSWMVKPGVPAQVMIDGPYGGSGVDLGDFERVLLIAGGSGVTFTLGLLDDIVGRCVKLGRREGERTRTIEFAWCIRQYACIEWVAPLLTELSLCAEKSSIDLHITIFVTCLCDPEAIPPIPNCDIQTGRPNISDLTSALIGVQSSSAAGCCERGDGDSDVGGGDARKCCIGECHCGKEEDEEEKDGDSKKKKKGVLPELQGGGLAVVAAGPGTMARETKNAVARLSMTRGQRIGRVGCHTEVYSL